MDNKQYEAQNNAERDNGENSPLIALIFGGAAMLAVGEEVAAYMLFLGAAAPTALYALGRIYRGVKGH